jgi:hypothetical protein
MRLSRPPPPRLVVPAPNEALLGNAEAARWAHATSDALVAAEVPALPGKPHAGDWQLAVSATLSGQNVVPRYAVLDPAGKPRGEITGAPVPAAAWENLDDGLARSTAAAAAPQLVSLLVAIDAKVKQSNPDSLLNRPARLYLAPVTGAPGDGNVSLFRQMHAKLPDLGDQVTDDQSQADFIVRGVVKVTHLKSGEEQAEIHWYVLTPEGHEAGDVAQGHDLPPGTLDGYWGDIASVVAEEAAGGVHEVVANWSGRHKPQAAATAAK